MGGSFAGAGKTSYNSADQIVPERNTDVEEFQPQIDIEDFVIENEEVKV